MRGEGEGECGMCMCVCERERERETYILYHSFTISYFLHNFHFILALALETANLFLPCHSSACRQWLYLYPFCVYLHMQKEDVKKSQEE